MKVTLHNHIINATQTFEGTPEQVETHLRRRFHWLNQQVLHGDLEGCLEMIDTNQAYSIELDEQGANELHLYKSEAPLERYMNGHAVTVRLKDLGDIEAVESNPDKTQSAEQRFAAGLTPPPIRIRVNDQNQRSLDSGHHLLSVARRKRIEELPAIIRVECKGCGTDLFADANGNPERCKTEDCDGENRPHKPKDFNLNAEPDEPALKTESDPREENLLRAMHGFQYAADSAFDTARFMAGAEVSVDHQAQRRALLKHDGDVEYAALDAYGFEITDANLDALRGLDTSTNFAKAETEAIPEPVEILPAHPDATDAVEEIGRAFAAGTFHIVKLNGKHSGGSMIGKDPQTNHQYLLKPGAGDNSPAQGVAEESASQSRREAAFWHVADILHLGEYMPRSDLVYIDGKEVAAIQMLPLSFKNFGDASKEDKSIIPQSLQPYLAAGMLHKWAIIDYILGNPDRHSQNLMIDDDHRTLRLIDHGSAMAGRSFDPAHDENSFIPFYLRAFTSMKFADMKDADRLRKMPLAGIEGSKAVNRWFAGIDENRVASVLSGYGIDPEPAVARIGEIRMFPGNKDAVVDKLWAGVGVEHPA
jgi:hypothetical protein